MNKESVRRLRPGRIVASLLCLVLASFWIYAFFFADTNKRNLIGDKSWPKYAESICAKAEQERFKLADFSRIEGTPEELTKRAGLVEQATDGLDVMVQDLGLRTPSDENGLNVVKLWLAEYMTYLEDRREYIVELRAGNNVTFSETAIEGVPISERLLTFANENNMASCAPPTDVAG
jgi:hypothetical protein